MSRRLFKTHAVRTTGSLEGMWDAWPTRDSADAGPPAATPSEAVALMTPGVWEARPGWERYRGSMWYRKAVTLPAGWVRFCFEGVSHTARVFLDGVELGGHDDAFTPWSVATRVDAPGEHTLTLHVDNSFGDHSALHLENDYYTYGGITRPAEWQRVDAAHIERVALTPRRDGERWLLGARLVLRNLGDGPVSRTLVAEAFGATHVLAADMAIEPGEGNVFEGQIEVPADAGAWSPVTPRLHEVRFVLRDGAGDELDDLIERTGLRTVEIKGDRLLLNGEPTRLMGFNRHEDHPQFGCALPVEAMAHDLVLMRDLGANAVRTSHYPNDQRFLDLCDELGVLVWEESHARSVSFEHPLYREQIDRSTSEMIAAHLNHPSIVIWGCLNECETRTPEGAAEHGRVLNLMRGLDPSRPTTYASMYDTRDLAYAHADVVSWNRYDTWYGDQSVSEALQGVLDWLHGDAESGGAGKPVILSEFGAGAIYGWRSPRAERWTEEYQVASLRASLEVYLEHPAVVGAFIWQFCDVRVTEHGPAKGAPWPNRPRCMNNKGVVDEYRRPKLAYAAVRELMTAARDASEA